MALVTVQRSPSPSNTPDSVSSELGELDETDHGASLSPQRQRRSKSALKKFRKFFNSIRFVSRLRLSESYFAVKGAALILPQSECTRKITKGSHGGDIQNHLQSMFYLLRPEDTIKVAVKLESMHPSRNRYLVVVSTNGRQDTEESVILGVECSDKSIICLLLPIWSGTEIKLDGDGGFSVTSDNRIHKFKPVSVQAMWSALQSLIKVKEVSEQNSYFPGGLTHTWIAYYNSQLTTEQSVLAEWYFVEDSESLCRPDRSSETSPEKLALHKRIHNKLKEIMMTVDLEEVTSKFLRLRLEEELQMDLQEYRRFVDEEMIIILGQMDASSKIFDFLYLGSEWNASNLEELKQNGIGHILNITKEIDNFYPGTFHYMNIREWDVEESDLLKYWEHTYKFISNARDRNSKVLVHCKMGISRSSSTVIAFAMKDTGWSLDEAFNHVKQCRSCVKPNKGFWKQLQTYEGILDASKQRHNLLFRSKSDNIKAKIVEVPSQQPSAEAFRPKSWSHNTAAPIDITLQESTDGAASCQGKKTCVGGTPPTAVRLPGRDEPGHSSPSEHSADDVFLEMTETPAIRGRELVTLLSYHEVHEPWTESHTDDFHDSSEEEPLTDMSDLDSYSSSSSESLVAAYYDVSMFLSEEEDITAREDESELQDEASWAGSRRAVPMQSELREMFNVRLCADMSEEDKMAHDRIAMYFASSPFGKHHMTPSKTEDSNNNAASDLSSLSLVNPQPTKVRADNSWIKEVPPSPNIAAVSEVSSKSLGSEELEIQIDKGGTTDDTEKTDDLKVDRPMDIVLSDCSVELKTKSADSIQIYETKSSEIALDECSKPSEQISEKPVLESSVESSQAKESHSLSVSSGSGVDVASLRGSHERLQLEASEEFRKEEEPTAKDDDTVSRPTSIYETEDIHLEPGLVQKVRQEIEERQRVDSLVSPSSDDDAKPVQRSSSLKVDSKAATVKRDRDTERRRTCTPILRTPSPEPAESMTKSSSTTPADSPVSPAEDNAEVDKNNKDLKVYKVGHETVTFLPGKVRRQTKDFEEKYSESSERGEESDSKETSPEPGESVFDNSSSIPSQQLQPLPVCSSPSKEAAEDGSRLMTASVETAASSPAYQEEDITWQVGAVRQHKETFENITKENQQQSSSMLKRSSRDISQEEPAARMTSETLQLIREIGSCLLDSPVQSRKGGQRIMREPRPWDIDEDGMETFHVGFVDNIRREIEQKQRFSESERDIVLTGKSANERDVDSVETGKKVSCIAGEEECVESVKVHDMVMNLEKNEAGRKERAISPDQSAVKGNRERSKKETEAPCESQPNAGSPSRMSADDPAHRSDDPMIQQVHVEGSTTEKEGVAGADGTQVTDVDGCEEKTSDKTIDLIKVRDLVGKFEVKEGKTKPESSNEGAEPSQTGKSDMVTKTRALSRTESDSSKPAQTSVSESEDTVHDLDDTASQVERRYSFSSASQTTPEKKEIKRHSGTFTRLPSLDSSALRQKEPDHQNGQRRVRKQHGKSHPLSRLSASEPLKQRSLNPFYNTM